MKERSEKPSVAVHSASNGKVSVGGGVRSAGGGAELCSACAGVAWSESAVVVARRALRLERGGGLPAERGGEGREPTAASAAGSRSSTQPRAAIAKRYETNKNGKTV